MDGLTLTPMSIHKKIKILGGTIQYFILKHYRPLGNEGKEMRTGKVGNKMVYQEDSEEWKECCFSSLHMLFCGSDDM